MDWAKVIERKRTIFEGICIRLYETNTTARIISY